MSQDSPEAGQPECTRLGYVTGSCTVRGNEASFSASDIWKFATEEKKSHSLPLLLKGKGKGKGKWNLDAYFITELPKH